MNEYNPNNPEIVEAHVAAIAMDNKMTKAIKKRKAADVLVGEASQLEKEAAAEGDAAIKEYQARSREIEKIKNDRIKTGESGVNDMSEKERSDYGAYLELMLKQGIPEKKIYSLEQLKGRHDPSEEQSFFERWQRIVSQNMLPGAKVKLIGKHRDFWLRLRKESNGRSFGELDEDGVGMVEAITPVCKLVFNNEHGGNHGRKPQASPFNFTVV